MMKRIIVLALVLALLFAFTGCAGDSAGSADPVKMGRVEYAAHGTKCFTVTVVAMQGDKISGVSIDEYQFVNKDNFVGVPNSDKDFGENYANPDLVLASKITNDGPYSDNMKNNAGATKSLVENWTIIEDFAIGKTVAELEDVLSTNTQEEILDTISGATLVDTHGYLASIVEAAKAAK